MKKMGFEDRCEACGNEIRHGYESVHVSDSDGSLGRLLCLECFNREMAAFIDIDFQHPHFSPKGFVDTEGKKHTFYFATRLADATRISIEAYEENADHGYRFQVLGMIENVQGLYLKLLGRIKRALSWQHLIMENGRVTVDDDLSVRGRFEWDEAVDRDLPLLIIDGKPVTWDNFGQILRTYEGWQFKLQIFDPSDEPT